MKTAYRYDEVRPTAINLSRVGSVTIFNVIGGKSNYNNLVGQTSVQEELVDSIYDFMKRESAKDLILKPRLEGIAEGLIAKGLNVK